MITLIMILIVGLLIGNFLSICVYRIPRSEAIMITRSYCPICKQYIKWYDMIPILSFILLRGKCRFCQKRIPISYLIIDILNGMTYVWLYTVYGLTVQFLGMAFLASTLLVVSFIDLKHKQIPNRIIIILLGGGIIYNIMNVELTIINSILGLFSASIPLLILSRGGVGGGDIKLMAAAGVFLGWELMLLALFIASIICSVIGVVLILMKVIKRRQVIPFGPFLSIGLLITMLYGQNIIQWYLRR